MYQWGVLFNGTACNWSMLLLDMHWLIVGHSQSLTAWFLARIFLPGVLPRSCKIMEDYAGRPGNPRNPECRNARNWKEGDKRVWTSSLLDHWKMLYHCVISALKIASSIGLNLNVAVAIATNVEIWSTWSCFCQSGYSAMVGDICLDWK